MAENDANMPGGALPPKPAEAKVQPKKETVRITLPPKPTASPTVKLPMLPGAAASTAGTAPTAPGTVSVPPPPAAAPAPRAAAPPSAAPAPPSGVKVAGAAPRSPTSTSAAKTPAPAPAPQKAVAPKPAATVGVFDKVLAVVAFVVCGAAVGTMVFLMKMLDNTMVKYTELADTLPK